MVETNTKRFTTTMPQKLKLCGALSYNNVSKTINL